MNTRSLQAGRRQLIAARAKIDTALKCVESALSPVADKTLGVTKAEYIDGVLDEVDGQVQAAIDTLYDAQNNLERREKTS